MNPVHDSPKRNTKYTGHGLHVIHSMFKNYNDSYLRRFNRIRLSVNVLSFCYANTFKQRACYRTVTILFKPFTFAPARLLGSAVVAGELAKNDTVTVASVKASFLLKKSLIILGLKLSRYDRLAS